ncbi:MAG: 6-phosphofructokinase [Clostridia bacterium]|nr:6-phosphofructokinase [Clostridia bacterium]
MKKIGVLTSGGDAPGMNAAIRAVVRSACAIGMEVVAFRKGYYGLLTNLFEDMGPRSVSDILHRGGTILQSARCPEFKEPEAVAKAVENAKAMGIEGLVVIGGDGSFRGARDLSLAGLPTVGIPGTIDNDIGCTDYTIGFDTALNTVQEAIDKIRDTCRSHDRCSVVEVMGRDAGYIAVNVGIACGAEAIIIPEKDFDFKRDILSQIKSGIKRGKEQHLIIVAEGVTKDNMSAIKMAERIEEETGIETRATILGHIQRGGNPTVKDRVTASRMGVAAVDLLNQGLGNRIVAIEGDKIVDYDILEGLNMHKNLDNELVGVAEVLSL